MLFITISINKIPKITRIKRNNPQILPKTNPVILQTTEKQNKIFTANNGNNPTKDTKNSVNKNREHNSVKELQIDHHFKNISVTFKSEHDYKNKNKKHKKISDNLNSLYFLLQFICFFHTSDLH